MSPRHVGVVCRRPRGNHIFQITPFTRAEWLLCENPLHSWEVRRFSDTIFGVGSAALFIIRSGSPRSFRLSSASRPRVKGVAGHQAPGGRRGAAHNDPPYIPDQSPFVCVLRQRTHKFLYSGIAGSPFQRVRALWTGQGKSLYSNVFWKRLDGRGRKVECGEDGNNG